MKAFALLIAILSVSLSGCSAIHQRNYDAAMARYDTAHPYSTPHARWQYSEHVIDQINYRRSNASAMMFKAGQTVYQQSYVPAPSYRQCQYIGNVEHCY